MNRLQLAGFPEETLGVVWLKLKGRISPFKHKKGIPVVLEILSSTFRIETAR